MTAADALPRSTADVPLRLLTTAQVAAACQVSQKTIYRAISRGTLRASRLGRGGGFRIWIEDMERWIESMVVARANSNVHAPQSPRAIQFEHPMVLGPMRRADGRLRLDDVEVRSVSGIEKRARRRRDGEAYFVWRVRWQDPAGKKRATTFDSERDAKDFQAKLRLARRGGELDSLDGGRETLAEFAAEWWKLEATPNLQRATLRAYASFWNHHLLPRLGHLQLRELTPHVIVRFRAELESQGVGVEAIRRTMTMLQGMLSRAVEWQRIKQNPVKVVRKPRPAPRRAVRPIAPLVVERMRSRLIADDRQRDAVLVCVLAYAGVRPQEALAMRWRHVRERTLLIEAALADGKLKEQKTGRPPRTVDLLVPLRHDLVAWRLASPSADDSELLFPTGDGNHWREHDYRNWRKRSFQPAARACGVETSRPYDLRHSFASLLIHEGRCSVVELARSSATRPP